MHFLDVPIVKEHPPADYLTDPDRAIHNALLHVATLDILQVRNAHDGEGVRVPLS